MAAFAADAGFGGPIRRARSDRKGDDMSGFRFIDGQIRPRIRKPAFTLVELLVVIGIIALLVAILLPALNKARSQANYIKCQANLRSIGQAFQIYVYNYHGLLPFGQYNPQMPNTNINTGLINFSALPADTGSDWTILLQSVMASNAGATFQYNASGGFGNGGVYSNLRQVYTCPDAPQGAYAPNSGAELSHYASNPRLMPQLGQLDHYFNVSGPGKCFHSYEIAHIQRSSEIALIFDGSLQPLTNGGGWSVNSNGDFPVGVNVDSNNATNAVGIDGNGFAPFLTDQYQMAGNLYSPNDAVFMTPCNSGAPEAAPYPDLNLDTTPNQQNIRFRHLGNTTANALMVDGHVESFKFDRAAYLATIAGAYAAPSTLQGVTLQRKNLYVNPP
jgi:prepilin-type N-terminal cleavage/methylation domain-containing protein/prepilin-type processing-associated H-X9-DG protein